MSSGIRRLAFAACLLGMTLPACGDDGSSDATTTASTSASTGDDGSSSGGSDGSSSSGPSTTSGTSSSTSSSTGDATSDTTTGGGSTGDATTGGGAGLNPPAGQSSGGSGGGQASGAVRMTAGGVTYRVIAPNTGGPLPAMIVYSGTEGGAQMTQNLLSLAGMTGNGGTVFGVLDGTTYFGNGGAGAEVLDELRLQYDVDNDRTYLLSESAGTSAGLELGLQLRQSYFAAYWANDVNASQTPTLTTAELGFEPYGNAGPGGDFANANAIVQGMTNAGYRVPAPAPYDGPGADTHGSTPQFVSALQWFPGKTRQ